MFIDKYVVVYKNYHTRQTHLNLEYHVPKKTSTIETSKQPRSRIPWRSPLRDSNRSPKNSGIVRARHFALQEKCISFRQVHPVLSARLLWSWSPTPFRTDSVCSTRFLTQTRPSSFFSLPPSPAPLQFSFVSRPILARQWYPCRIFYAVTRG